MTEQTKRKIVVIDSMSYIYRAYYGLTPLTDNKYGQNINAFYWFAKFLLSVINVHKPDNIIVALEGCGTSIRKKILPEYKATRREMEENFYWRVDKIKAMLEYLQVPTMFAEWYEADDTIASIINYWNKETDEFVVMTNDKDLHQLLAHDNVKIYSISKKDFISEDDFEKTYWFTEPKYVLDYLMMVWDSSDNIKWVNGIGKKTASDLIKEHGWLPNIVAFLEKKLEQSENEETPKKDRPKMKKAELALLDGLMTVLTLNKRLISLHNIPKEEYNKQYKQYEHNKWLWTNMANKLEMKSILSYI